MKSKKTFDLFLFYIIFVGEIQHMKRTLIIFVSILLAMNIAAQEKINRRALVERHAPQVTRIDPLDALSVGNGRFAYTVDATGMQSFPELYSQGVPLGTQSQWGWHSFDNPENLRFEETLREVNLGHGHKELYTVQQKDDPRSKAASDWYRVNPHRLHLGIFGFDFLPEEKDSIKNIHQQLDMWKGIINSHFEKGHDSYDVRTAVDPHADRVLVEMVNTARTPLIIRFPYPTGGHCDDACEWQHEDKHLTEMIKETSEGIILKRTLGGTVYYVSLSWKGKMHYRQKSKHAWLLQPQQDRLYVSCAFSPTMPTDITPMEDNLFKATADYWKAFWTKGAAVDFTHCTDPRAFELERRVVLSQYLLAIQCAGDIPPQETGLTYNSWFGKFHLEMIYWHEAWLPLWNHPEMLERTMKWYHQAIPNARTIARRQGFKGLRWMKMTDPSSIEAPSSVGSYLIWQQPHIITLAELIYRRTQSKSFLEEYYPLIEETSVWMADFVNYDKKKKRYLLRGFIPAQETLKAAETVNAPFELSYWHYGLLTAQKWRERMGLPRNKEWDKIIGQLSPLASDEEGRYLAAESAVDTYRDIRFTSDHMAVLGALGILPMNNLIDKQKMQRTLNWVWDNWNWNKTWGWDYPMTAMCAARLGDGEKAVGALLMNNRTNTYLVSGHNYQDARLRLYLPGNGGLLTAIAMMCAGWDGNKQRNPGFPQDGSWDVRWEGLQPLP